MKNLLLSLLGCALLFNSCQFIGGKRIKGNGNIRTEERNVSPFKNIEVHGAMDVYISQGDFKPLRVEGDENLLEYIETIQEGNKLVVKTRNGFNPNFSGDPKIYITAPVYESIDVSGACDIIGQSKLSNSEDLEMHVSGAGEINMEVDAPEISTGISGSGKINLKGETKKLEIKVSGAGEAHCFDLLSETTKVDISGAGNAEVYASVKLQVEVSGAGDVKYKGSPKDINQQIHGAGSVKKAD